MYQIMTSQCRYKPIFYCNITYKYNNLLETYFED